MQFQPEALRRREEEVYGDSESRYLIRRARECLLWKMDPEYYDSMTQKEYRAWLIAWNELQKEGRKA